MAARRYEISLRVLKNISRVSVANTQIMKRRRNFEEKFCISKRPCKVLFIISVNANEISSHFALIAGVKGAALVRKILFCHSKIKFISLSRRAMFFLIHRQKDIDKIIDFYSPKSNCDGSNLQYSNIRHCLQ